MIQVLKAFVELQVCWEIQAWVEGGQGLVEEVLLYIDMGTNRKVILNLPAGSIHTYVGSKKVPISYDKPLGSISGRGSMPGGNPGGRFGSRAP